MASASKVGWAQLKVGILAAVSLFILAVLLFLLTGNKSLFSKEHIVYTYLPDSAAITEGSAVRLNGILVGKIEQVGLSGEKDPRRVVKLTMAIDANRLASIPADSEAAIGAENLLGTKYINIKMGQDAKALAPGGTLRSLDTREFQDIVNAAYPTMTSLQGIVQRVERIVGLVEAGKGSIGKLLTDDGLYNRLTDTVGEGQQLISSLNKNEGTIGRLLHDETLYNEVRSSVQRLDKMMADVQAGQGTAGKLLRDPALYDETRSTILEMKKLIAAVNTGDGTAGKLIKDPKLYNDLDQLTVRLDGMLARLQKGEGTLGQLLVNQSLYESLDGSMRDMQGFMKDFRANPKKFLTIQLKLF